MTKDIRGIEAKTGDIVAVGVTSGSSGGWLSIRRVIEVKDGKVFMESKSSYTDTTRRFVYKAASGFLILPKSYADAFGLE